MQPDDPEIVPGPSEVEGRRGQPLMLLCGTNLDGNPRPTISWIDPKGRTVQNSSHYRYIDDAMGVVLNLSCLSHYDVGNWMCVLSSAIMSSSPPVIMASKTIEIFVYLQGRQ